MKILLLVPQSRLPVETRVQPPLGIAYIGAVSLQRGDEVRLVDMNVDDTDLATLAAWPDLVGITANTSQIKGAWRAARALRDAGCAAPLVLGGVHATVLPQESLEAAPLTIIVRGEGEETWEEVCQAVQAGPADLPAALNGIAGISYCTDGGVVVHNPDRVPANDLDALPWPAYNLFHLDLYTSLQPTLDHAGKGVRSFSIMTSRGCPYRCSYCSQSIFKYRWRARTPENVVAEWRHLVRELGATEIGVLDDSFNIDRKRVLAICDLLIAQDLQHVPWIMINGIRANLADEEVLGRMKAAGCKRTAFGVESGNQTILNGIDKKLELDEVRAAFRAARKVGLETIGFFMVGLPGDTEATVDQTIRLACELDPVVANFSMTTPFPGTALYEQVKEAERQGRGRLLINDWDNFIFLEGRARYEMDGLTAELQERKWKEAYRRFYLRPRRVAQTLLRKNTWLELPRTVRMAWRMVWNTK
jgi:anaerobic magnesium-protoporphyrin IX monomethyl ester cyclase